MSSSSLDDEEDELSPSFKDVFSTSSSITFPSGAFTISWSLFSSSWSSSLSLDEEEEDFASSSAISGSGIIFSSSTTSSNTSFCDAGISSSLLSASSSDADFEMVSSFASFKSAWISWISADSFSCSSSLDDEDEIGFSGCASLRIKSIQNMIL